MPHIQTLELNSETGKFVLEPLERGFGQTIGNALRRVLLSQIQGAAITAIKIDKVFHEFAPIPGVKEDTTQLILNLKNVAIRCDFETTPPDEIILQLDVKGPGRVTGADIVCPPGTVVVNPDVYIATISDAKSSLTMDLFVNWSSGYVLPDKQERYKGTIGSIAVGSQFTPVRKSNYFVEATRVGTRTDYERLILDIETNGAVSPNDALTQAAHILDKYFRMFFELGRSLADFEDIEEDDEDEGLTNVPDIKIEELDFSQRTFNCLRRANLGTLRALAGVTEADLSGIRGFGKKSLTEVREKLAEHGLALKPPKGGYRAIDLLDDDEEDFD
jgi:DNA-directed RNA polymerase subunit alpha